MHATNLSVKQYFNGHFYPKCKSDNGKYPDGFFQNEDCNCFPQHDKCSKGYHSQGLFGILAFVFILSMIRGKRIERESL